MVKSLDVAYAFIARHGDNLALTNLKLNKLVYFAQVESLRQRGAELFDDVIEAWEYGPVEPAVYHEFKRFGKGVIRSCQDGAALACDEAEIVDYVARNYGTMTAFDLVSLSHREGGAWSLVFEPHVDRVVRSRDIIDSVDFEGVDGVSETFEAGMRGVMRAIPNALMMLENS